MSEIATPLSYLVLQKQRRDPQVASSPAKQAREVETSLYSRISGLKALDAATPTTLYQTSDDLIFGGRYWKHGKR